VLLFDMSRRRDRRRRGRCRGGAGRRGRVDRHRRLQALQRSAQTPTGRPEDHRGDSDLGEGDGLHFRVVADTPSKDLFRAGEGGPQPVAARSLGAFPGAYFSTIQYEARCSTTSALRRPQSIGRARLQNPAPSALRSASDGTHIKVVTGIRPRCLSLPKAEPVDQRHMRRHSLGAVGRVRATPAQTRRDRHVRTGRWGRWRPLGAS
jgi:hypothetical protein